MSLHRFGADHEDREFVEKNAFGASYSTRKKLLLIARHIMTTGLHNAFKVGGVKFANSLSQPHPL